MKTLGLRASVTGYCVFSKILKYILDSGCSGFSRVVYMDEIMAGRTPAAELAEFRKILRRKHKS